jgi:DNA-directed RNA polymerase specialized sigma24 family protein
LERLLPDLARGDRRAFEAFYEGYLSRVYGYVFRRVPHPVEAETVTEAAFTMIVHGLLAEPERGNLDAWVLGCVRTALAHARRAKAGGDEMKRACGPPPAAAR